jgi:transmembrane sensor
MTANYVQDQDDEEAALWVARHMSNVVDATAFAEWLAGAPGRREMFDALWATCMDDAVTGGIRLHEQQALASEPAVQRPRFGRRAAIGLGAAAACVAVVGFSWPELRFAMTPAQHYATRAGEVRSFTLADGSTVLLNGASRVSARIGQGRREVALEAGEALFDVEHDEARPFRVSAGQGRVTVLGTRFDLALNGRSVDLAVERGLVRFDSSEGGATAVLVPAAHRSALVDGRIARPIALEGASASGWRDGWLQVADMPLEQVVPQLQRWTARTITVADPALLRKRIAGRFRLSQPGTVLENLGVLYGFKVRQTEQAYILERK